MARTSLSKRPRENVVEDVEEKKEIAEPVVAEEENDGTEAAEETNEDEQNNCDESKKRKTTHYKPETLELQRLAAEQYKVASEENRLKLYIAGFVREQQNAKHSKNRVEKRKSQEHRAKKDLKRAMKQRDDALAKIYELQDSFGLTVIQKNVIVTMDELKDEEDYSDDVSAALSDKLE